MAICGVCFRHCELKEGQMGFCGARVCAGGEVRCASYGYLTALALDPIEKKPLRRFHPGEMILSVGSYGCNLRCPFCQNASISWSPEIMTTAAEQAENCAAAWRREIAQGDAGSEGQRPGVQKSEGQGSGAQSSEVRGSLRRTRKRRIRRERSARETAGLRSVTPEQLTDLAASCRGDGNMGVAFTYNEPLIGYEFVRDTARLIHEAGMVNVMVTNGTAEPEVLEELAPHIDAMNIDLKGFTDRYYQEVLGGSREMVMEFIRGAAETCHVELTTLIIPGENDSEEEMRALSRWVASLRDGRGRLIGPEIPLHISRFFPQFHMTDRAPTDVSWIYHLADIAREHLEYVYTGNC